MRPTFNIPQTAIPAARPALSDATRTTLQQALTGSVVIAGVGNRLRGDDAAGPLLVDAISGVLPNSIDCGVAPENHLEKIAQLKARTVLIVDAAGFGGQPGEVRVFSPDEVSSGDVSTHGLSLSMAADYLKARGSPCILLAGIQPQSTNIGDEPCPQVIEAVEILSKVIKEVVHA